MTNSYNSSKKTLRLVFIHGLNNNPESFGPLISRFNEAGYETELMILPGHGEVREECSSYKRAFSHFNNKMSKITKSPYAVIAFSTGALYLQLWLEKNPENKPVAQVLLAPALYLKRQKLIERLMNKLPSFLIFRSLSPKPFRRYQTMKIWEYKTLLESVNTYQKIQGSFRIPTMVLIDPLDELVDAGTVKERLEDKNPGLEVEMFVRTVPKRGLGQHHIIFHPAYFQEQDWNSFANKITIFLNKNE